jgi:hypothetical protein
MMTPINPIINKDAPVMKTLNATDARTVGCPFSSNATFITLTAHVDGESLARINNIIFIQYICALPSNPFIHSSRPRNSMSAINAVNAADSWSAVSTFSG